MIQLFENLYKVKKMEKYDIKLLDTLDITIKNEIDQYAKLVQFYKNDTPFLNDELMKYFYIIIEGKMRTYQLNLKNSKEQTIFILKSGDMFDTITLLDHKPHDVMYEVLENTKALKIPIEHVRVWLRKDDLFSKNFFIYLASQMRHTEELATDLSLHDTLERLIKLLAQNLDPNNRSKYNLLHNLSHSDIAKLIGTVRHVVERHLNSLKNRGAIEASRKYLEVKDLKKLLENL